MKLRSVLASLALLAGSALASVGLVEVGLRLFALTGNALARQVSEFDPLAVQIEPCGELGFCQRPNSVFHYPNGTAATSNGMGYRGPAVAEAKPPGTVRILLLGESTTHGWGVNDDQTIDAYMRSLLPGQYPSLRFEVVNLAFDGYDSYQIFERLRTDGLRLDPDVIIVNTGINDVRSARFPHLQDRDPRTMLWAGDLARMRAERKHGGPTLWTYVKHYLYAARLPGILLQRWRTAGSVEVRLNVTPHPEAAQYFERNLLRIVALAAARHIPLILSTPPSLLGLAGAPGGLQPHSYWIVDAATTQRYRDTLAARMRSVADSLGALGREVTYVAHSVPVSMFIDDAHLTPQGNRQMAVDFAAGLAPLLRTLEAQRLSQRHRERPLGRRSR